MVTLMSLTEPRRDLVLSQLRVWSNVSNHFRLSPASVLERIQTTSSCAWLFAAAVAALAFPGGTIQAFLAGWGYGATSPVTFLAVVVPPMACVVVSYLSWVLWLCPQCGWPFRLAWFRNGWLTRQCVHCGLPMWDAPLKMKPDGKSPMLDELA